MAEQHENTVPIVKFVRARLVLAVAVVTAAVVLVALVVVDSAHGWQKPVRQGKERSEPIVQQTTIICK